MIEVHDSTYLLVFGLVVWGVGLLALVALLIDALFGSSRDDDDRRESDT